MLKTFFTALTIFSTFIWTSESTAPSECLEDCSIQHVEGSKVYLKPGTTAYIGEDGIYLSLQGFTIPVRHLSSDEHGIYFDAYTAGFDDDWVIPCPHCGVPLTLFGRLNRSCPSKQ